MRKIKNTLKGLIKTPEGENVERVISIDKDGKPIIKWMVYEARKKE